jgi:fatty acyl-CoA reductase
MDTAAIFDVDGTLCATNSTTSLIWLRGRQHAAWRHRLWLASLLWRAPVAFVADSVSRDLADRMVYQQFAGLSLSRMRDDAVHCCEKVLLPACFPEALAELTSHRAAGRRIVLLSGGIEIVLRPLADALGAELLARSLVAEGDRLTGGYTQYDLPEDHATASVSQADGKLLALQRHARVTGIDLAGSYAYGDSINDIKVLSAVGRAVVINPDRRMKRTANSQGWEIRHWRHVIGS